MNDEMSKTLRRLAADLQRQAEDDARWRELARREAEPTCSDPDCDCHSLRG